MGLTFEWDDRKDRQNHRKHGVSFREAATVFGDSLSLTIEDPDHSVDKPRFITIGESTGHRLLVVVHADRGDDIRIISARVSSKHERKSYEEGT